MGRLVWRLAGRCWCGAKLRLEADALTMAACRFEEFVRTAGFTRLGEEALMCCEEYLRNRVAGMVGGEDGERMAGVVAEALRAQAARRGVGRWSWSCWGGRRQWSIGWGRA